MHVIDTSSRALVRAVWHMTVECAALFILLALACQQFSECQSLCDNELGALQQPAVPSAPLPHIAGLVKFQQHGQHHIVGLMSELHTNQAQRR
jgi:hypothetical protein